MLKKTYIEDSVAYMPLFNDSVIAKAFIDQHHTPKGPLDICN